MNKRRTVPLLAMSASAILSTIGYGSWIIPTLSERNGIFTGKPSRSVCYIAGASNIKYTEIEKALKVANNEASATDKKTVVVIPSLNIHDKTSPVTMINDIDGDGIVTIGPNVSLTIGCTEDDAINGTYAHTKISNASSKKRFADSEEDYNTYVKSNIGLSSKTTLRIEQGGSLNIGGYTGLGEGEQTPTGHTVQDFAQLTMFDNSKIDCFGTVNCYGFIKESSSNNNSSICANDNSLFYLPFVIYDYRGGSYSAGAAENKTAKSFPFNIYDFPNIQSTIHLLHGATFKGYVTVDTQFGTTYKDAEAIGSGGLFRLSENSEVSWKYQSPSSRYSYVYDLRQNGTNSGYNNISKTKVKIERGTFTFSSMSLNVGVSINTSDYFLPISYKYDIEVKKGAKLVILDKVKFLSGSSLTVNEGATAEFSNNVAFYQKYVDQVTVGVSGQNIYPQTLGPAKLINNGNLTLNSSFAGFIDNSKQNTGMISTGSSYSSNVNVNEVISGARTSKWSTKVSGDYKTIGCFGFGNISNSEQEEPVKKQFATNAKYLSRRNSAGQYYWLGDSSGSTNVDENVPSSKSGSYSYTACVLCSALVLMADGSHKEAGLIRTGDVVMSFNHETGTIEPNVVIGNDDISKPAQVYDVVHLEFSDGKSTDFIDEHGYFDVTLNKYVYLHIDDAEEYIGHEFVSANGNLGINTVKLVSVSVIKTFTKLCSPATANSLNIIADGMLSIAGGLTGLFNIFDYDPKTHAFDKEKMQADIRKYGLLTYKDFERFFPEEIYNLLPCKYLGISIGKGLISWDVFEGYVNKWKDQLMENVK